MVKCEIHDHKFENNSWTAKCQKCGWSFAGINQPKKWTKEGKFRKRKK